MADIEVVSAPKSIIVDSLVTWAKGLITALLPLIDARSLVLIAGSGAGAWLAFPTAMKPVMLTAAQLVLAIIFAVGVAHLVRKILLSGDFKLSEYAEKALESPIASAIVFVAVLGFVAMIMMAIVGGVLPK